MKAGIDSSGGGRSAAIQIIAGPVHDSLVGGAQHYIILLRQAMYREYWGWAGRSNNIMAQQ